MECYFRIKMAALKVRHKEVRMNSFEFGIRPAVWMSGIVDYINPLCSSGNYFIDPEMIKRKVDLRVLNPEHKHGGNANKRFARRA